ncbi:MULTISPECIES: hypothetical protein [Streptomyces]|uniref:Lipoprotein n=1 Tax=Streptomyces viridochromogenes TaxID=1938 RepID=A0A0L8JFP8_STRVR|nr:MULTISPECIES: hypothetical protein [Streptomyces]KOG12503.1 hypothetical protein ADK34_32265 [Streptomyces viridochromogenes]
MRYTRLVIAAGVGTLLLTGCAEDAPEGIGAGGSVAREVVTEADIVLPVSAYFLTPEQQALVDTAHSTLASDCMKRFGFDWPVTKAEPVKAVSRRYGVVSEKVAAEHGYHVIPLAGDDHARGAVSGKAKLPPEAYMVFGAKGPKGGQAGSGGSYRGKDIPEGGCVGEAQRKLGLEKVQNPEKGKIGLLSIDFSSFEQAQRMPEFIKVQDAWVSCMKKAGYQHAAFLQPGEKFTLQGNSASPQEKAAAKADVKCKQDTKLATVLLRLETQIQNDYIEQNAAGFAEIKKDQGAVIKSANAALAN